MEAKMKNLGEVLTDRQKELGLSYREIAVRAGVSDVYISLVFRGKRVPGDEVLIRIAQALELDAQHLIYRAHWEKAPEEAKGYFEGISLPREGPGIDGVKRFDHLDPYQLGQAHTIPVVGWVQAGQFAPTEDGGFAPGAADEYVYSDIKGRNLFALRVENNSMEPLFHERDILIVNPNIKPRTGDYVVVKLAEEGEATFKKLIEKDRIIILRPLNPDYEDIILTPEDDFEVIGKVVERKTIF
jgi:SOS-response transcriptional repressor LexA